MGARRARRGGRIRRPVRRLSPNTRLVCVRMYEEYIAPATANSHSPYHSLSVLSLSTIHSCRPPPRLPTSAVWWPFPLARPIPTAAAPTPRLTHRHRHTAGSAATSHGVRLADDDAPMADAPATAETHHHPPPLPGSAATSHGTGLGDDDASSLPPPLQPWLHATATTPATPCHRGLQTDGQRPLPTTPARRRQATACAPPDRRLPPTTPPITPARHCATSTA